MSSRKWSLFASFSLLAIGGFILFGPLVHVFHLNVLHDITHHQKMLIAPLLGLLFIYLGVTLPRGFRLTLHIALVATISSTVFCTINLIQHLTMGTVLFLALLVTTIGTLLPLYRKPHRHSSIAPSWYNLIGLGAVIIAGLSYGALGFVILSHTAFHSPSPSPLQGAEKTIEAMLLPNELIAAPTHTAQLFIASLDAIGFVIVALALGVFIRPIALRIPHSLRDQHDLEALLRHHPTDADDYFKLWPQPKRYFFSPSRRACITFLPARQSLFILGNPNGDQKEFPTLIKSFASYAHTHGWKLCIIMPSKRTARYYKAASHDLHTITLGTEAVVSLSDFYEKTAKNKHFRYVANKAVRDELSVEEITTMDAESLKKLRAISDEWLKNGRHEYTFFMGPFSNDYLRVSRVFVLKQRGQWLAYTSLLPTYEEPLASLDHFRFRTDMPSTGMHYLLRSVLLQLQREGKTDFHLGLAPLAHIRPSRSSSRVARIAKRLGGRYYSFDGVAQFKGKFEPAWKKAFVLYEGSPLGLPRLMSEFESISSYNRRLRRIVPIASGLAVILLVTLTVYIAAQ